jgi:RNA polymerase sigma-70 factor (ECF subfamily)
MSVPDVQDHDDDLVARAREGDHAAFGELVRRTQNEVYTLALRLTGKPDLASDVAQEAYIRAWRAMARFRGDAAFTTWMHRITVNTAWTVLRRARRHEGLPLDDVPAIVDDRAVTPEQAGEMSELRSTLQQALGELPLQQRTIVVMKDVYGWSHAEAAEALGISVTAAKVRLHRARKRLRELLWEESR